jgi:ATP-citrate lyase alpha-subunit
MNKPLFSKTSKAIFFNQQPQPIQRMLDYDFLIGRTEPSIVAIVNPIGGGFQKAFWGSKEIVIPVYVSLLEASQKHKDADVMINFASMRSAFASSLDAINIKSIRTVVITAEGMPENQTRELIREADLKQKWLIGPATVGAIKPGAIRIANTGGTIESIIEARLFRQGSVGVVTVSGGMLLETCHIVAKYADGASEAIAIGGDHFPGSTLLQNLLRLDADPEVRMLVMLGEIGGNAEYEVAEALKSKKITKPLVAWVSGTVAAQFPTEVQFGHAGAKSGTQTESAQAKNKALKDAGAHVPLSFNDFGTEIKKVFTKFVSGSKDYQAPSDSGYRNVPTDFKQALAENIVRRESSIMSGISDDRGEEPTYNKKEISYYTDKSIGHLLNALWFQGKLPQKAEEFLELCLKITADHGPAVVTAHNAITTARAGKDVIDSLVSGLLTIGPRHGGAIDGAGKWALYAVKNKLSARNFVEEMKQKSELIMGIGHRIKTLQNPDARVTLLKKFAGANLKQTPFLDFALEVEKETLKKKNNLILNVDGTIAMIFLDLLSEAKFTDTEINTIIDAGALNAIFALGRSIGIIGHVLDQKRLNEGLYRHPWDDILYL